MNYYLVGITGGSGAGKTFLLGKLIEAFSKDELTLISQDNYYYDLKDQPRDGDGQTNFDHPASMDLQLFYEHLSSLVAGNEVSVREYTFNNPDAVKRLVTYKPAPIILVEGLFVMHHPDIRNLMRLKVFVDADEHIKLSRRLIRDLRERGYTVEETLGVYVQQVVPMFKQYVEPHKSNCDIILANNESMNVGADVLVNHLKQVLTHIRATHPSAKVPV